MGLRTNIFFLLISAFLSFMPLSDAYAKVEAQSPIDFANEKGLSAIATALEKSGKSSETTIQCGKSLCDLSSEYCYLVVNQTNSPGGFSTTTSSYQCSSEVKKSSFYLGGSTTYKTCVEHCYKEEGFLTKGDYITAESNESPSRTYALLRGDKDSIAYADTDTQKLFGWCEVLPVKLYNYKKCFFCTLLGVVYTGSAQMTDIAFSKMAFDFVELLAIGLAIWIALQVLINVSSLTKQDIPKFINNTIKQSYKLVIACILLINSQQIFNYGVRPLIKAALTFGQSMVSTQDVFNGLSAGDKYLRQAGGAIGAIHLDHTIYDEIEKYAVVVQQELSFMQAIGSELFCVGGNIMSFKSWKIAKEFKELGPGFKMMVYGSVLVVFGFLLSLVFTFYLLDAIVQMGVAGGLAPFLIACWPFKVTAKWTKTGIDIFLNSLFVFIFVGLIMSINVELINTTMKTDGGGSLMEIAEIINEANADKLLPLTELSGMKFLILIFCCIFGFKFVAQGTSLASQFAKGTFNAKSAIAPSIATMGASALKNFALNSTKDTREAIGHRVEKVTEAILDSPYTLTKGGVKIGRNIISKIKSRKNPPAGNDTTLSAINGGDNPKGGSSGGRSTNGQDAVSSQPIVGEDASNQDDVIVGQMQDDEANPDFEVANNQEAENNQSAETPEGQEEQSASDVSETSSNNDATKEQTQEASDSDKKDNQVDSVTDSDTDTNTGKKDTANKSQFAGKNPQGRNKNSSGTQNGDSKTENKKQASQVEVQVTERHEKDNSPISSKVKKAKEAGVKNKKTVHPKKGSSSKSRKHLKSLSKGRRK